MPLAHSRRDPVHILHVQVEVDGQADFAGIGGQGMGVVLDALSPACVCGEQGEGLEVDVGGDAVRAQAVDEPVPLCLLYTSPSPRDS